MKKIVINADDFGISDGVNRGIIECHQNGVVSSASLIANLDSFENAVDLAERENRLGVGIHLNISCGSPISDPDDVKTLIDKDGFFWPHKQMISKLLLKKVLLSDIRREFSEQIKRVCEAGIMPSHLDSHHHIHFYPSIRKITNELAKEYRINRVRGSVKNLFRGFYIFPSMFLDKKMYMGFLHTLILSSVRRSEDNILSSDSLIGSSYVPRGRYQDAFLHFLGRAGNGLTEIFCHPGYVDKELMKYDRWTEMREEEMATLISDATKARIKELNLEIVNFSQTGYSGVRLTIEN